MSAYYNGVYMMYRTGDLCTNTTLDLPLNSGRIYLKGLNCPTPWGVVEVEQKAIFYEPPPPGIYSIRCKMHDQDDEPILCLDITIPM